MEPESLQANIYYSLVVLYTGMLILLKEKTSERLCDRLKALPLQ